MSNYYYYCYSPSYGSHLVWRPSRYEYSVAEALDDGVSLHAILLVEALPEGAVQVPGLVVDGVVVWLELVPALDGHLVEQITDFVGVPGMVDVPQRPWHLLLLPHTPPGQDVAAGLVDSLKCLCGG